MNRWLITILSVVGFALYTGNLSAGEPPRVLELRTQKVEATTYFHVRLEQPADLRLPTFDTSKPFSESDRRKFTRLPRLVSQDEKTQSVYYRQRPSQPWLSFCGQVPRDLPEHRRQGHYGLPGIVSGGCWYPIGQNSVVEAAPTPVNVWHFRLRCRFSFGVEVDLRVVV